MRLPILPPPSQLLCFDLEGKKMKVSALKHSSVNDILKCYYMVSTTVCFDTDDDSAARRMVFARIV